MIDAGLSPFDTVIERRATDSYKWRQYGERDVLPMPVADMDFAAPDAVLRALHERVDHAVFGYAEPRPAVTDAVLAYHRRRHGWELQPEWLVWLPGLEVGLNLVCRLPESPDAGVATLTPVSPPFLSARVNTGRRIARAPMTIEQGRYVVDLQALGGAVREGCGAFLFCNPQNPSGRSFRADELRAIGRVCAENPDLIVCSDEIHCDLILEEGLQHTPLAVACPELSRQLISLFAPSKTYNLAGMMCGYAVIPDETLRQRFRWMGRGVVTELNVFGYEACRAAYDECEEWRQMLVAYLRVNRDRVEAVVAELQGVSMRHTEATYLAWIDSRALQLRDPIKHFEDAGLGLSNGAWFGAPGFVRLNFACPRATLEEGLRRLRAGVATAGERLPFG